MKSLQAARIMSFKAVVALEFGNVSAYSLCFFPVMKAVLKEIDIFLFC